MAEDMVKGEKALGLSSVLVDCDNPQEVELANDADIQVRHTRIPETKDLGNSKIVWVAHGAMESGFWQSVHGGNGHGGNDLFMMALHYLGKSDAVVTFWQRQRRIWQSLCDKNTIVDYVPMGVDLDFWQPVKNTGKWAGTPSLFTAENSHSFKSPFDLFIAWPWVTEKIPTARLHCFYLPMDQHRHIFPLIHRNGAAFKSYVLPSMLTADGLRQAFSATDFYIGLVRYGDHNRMTMEAKASGAKVISYKGNIWADYWIDEGDQREIANQLTAILRNEIEPRQCPPVAGIVEMAEGMKKIYERIL